MRVFVSWSGDRSRAVAQHLHWWLQCVLQSTKPWISTSGIDRGSIWFSEIASQLHEAKVGIIVLTLENREKPWISFEAGALAKGLSTNRVCTFLVDLRPSDVTGPLAQFNHTLPDSDGVLRLIQTLNVASGESSLDDSVLRSVFATYWHQFETGFQEALHNHPGKPAAPRSPEDMIVDVLGAVRSLEHRMGMQNAPLPLSVAGRHPSRTRPVRYHPDPAELEKELVDIACSLPSGLRQYFEQLLADWQRQGMPTSARHGKAIHLFDTHLYDLLLLSKGLTP
jgi:hypothetical protein